MANSTHHYLSDHRKSALHASHSLSGKVGIFSPKADTVAKILAFSKALEVSKSTRLQHVSVVLN